jgi:hypothetical protein
VKVARRALRAAGLTTRYENTPGTLTSDQVDLYIKEMTQLEATQLDLEGLKIEAKSLPTFLDVNPRLDDRLRAMEQYLRDILWEFEEASATVKVAASLSFAGLCLLNELTGPTKEKVAAPTRNGDNKASEGSKRFKTHFSGPYDDVVKMVSRSFRFRKGKTVPLS